MSTDHYLPLEREREREREECCTRIYTLFLQEREDRKEEQKAKRRTKAHPI
jgi:hypothetical protein